MSVPKQAIPPTLVLLFLFSLSNFLCSHINADRTQLRLFSPLQSEYFDKVLDIDPEHAPAYISKLYAELKVRKEDDLCNNEKPISDMGNYQKAIRFSDDEGIKRLEGYDENIRERIQQKKTELIKWEKTCNIRQKNAIEHDLNDAESNQRYEIDRRDRTSSALRPHTRDGDVWHHFRSELQPIQDIIDRYTEKISMLKAELKNREDFDRNPGEWTERHYNELLTQKNRASTEYEYESLIGQFRKMNGYKNTKEITDECETQFLKLKERREEKERIEQEYHAAQEKKDKEEREQREAIEQERKDREYKEYKIAENHRKVGINVSFFIQICSFVALFIALNFKNGEVNISFGGIFFFIVLALIIFFLYGTAAESETTPLIANIIISIMILIIGSGIGGTSGISAIVSGLGTIVASITAFICADE